MALLCRLHAATEGPFIIPLQTPVMVYYSWCNYISDIQALFAIPKVAGQLRKFCTRFVTLAKNISAKERWIYTCYRLLSLAKTLFRLRSWFLLVTCYSLIVTLPIMGTADSIEISQWPTAQPLLQIKYQITKKSTVGKSHRYVQEKTLSLTDSLTQVKASQPHLENPAPLAFSCCYVYTLYACLT